MEAATAIPGRVDDDALLAFACCLTAMGEWDMAANVLEPILSKSMRARFLYFSIRAIQSGNTAALEAIADNPEYSGIKSEIMFILWKITDDTSSEGWRQRLENEFSQTPEGRLAASASSAASSAITVRPSPFWLFAGGLDSLPLIAVETAAQSPVFQPPASTARFQTGIFRSQNNAQSLMASLSQAGFSPSIEQRIVNNNEMWAVTVPVGTDQARTASQLRSAGFDSFLVR
jgi:hypothetical protein